MKKKENLILENLHSSNHSDALAKVSKTLDTKHKTSFKWGLWERLVPGEVADDVASKKILNIHLRRYETASWYVKGKRVLDIACGTGYGSQMLFKAGAKSVVGVDICSQTIDDAKQNYQAPGVEFVCADAEQFERLEMFDVIVSFETIEHLKHPDNFLKRIRQHLLPDGVFLLSAPLGETRHFDTYHIHKFSQKELFNLLKQAGFSVELHRIDEWFVTRANLREWKRLYKYSQPSVSELLFTFRGWRILADVIFKGGFNMPQLLIVSKVRS